MTQEVVLANATLVLPRETLRGAVRVKDGVIVDIAPGATVPRGAEDCGGDYVAPGLVELHTDNLERHIQPRPKVDWPHDAAILAHDAELAGSGLTTVFDAMRVGSIPSGQGRYLKYARGLATVTATPAHSVGLKDRGEIAPGKRADLVRFAELGETPALRMVFARGRRVA